MNDRPITASAIIASRDRPMTSAERERIDKIAGVFLEPIIERALHVITNHQRPGGHYAMKIHLVKVAGQDKPRLVKSHTRAGAEKFVRDSIKPAVSASVPTQDELVAALKEGIAIEDATSSPQASIPEPSQQEPQS